MAGELVLITGPPAVGKMTVGRALGARRDVRRFHNHHTIEPLLEIFGFGTPPFTVLNDEFRRRVIEEAAAHGLRLAFTFVWPVDSAGDAEVVCSYLAPYADRGLPVSFVELYAGLEARLVRNVQADRIAAKPSKSDLTWSDAHVRDAEQHRMNTDPAVPSVADDVLAAHRHLRLDNSDLTPDACAQRILAWLGERGTDSRASAAAP
jgi:hypothetical protein